MSDKMEKNENQVPVEEFVEVMPLVDILRFAPRNRQPRDPRILGRLQFQLRFAAAVVHPLRRKLGVQPPEQGVNQIIHPAQRYRKQVVGTIPFCNHFHSDTSLNFFPLGLPRLSH